jgi:outer membrane biosynthesis protein TonB
MYFNFDDNHPDTPRLPQPLSRREVVLIAVNIHALALIAILLGPRLPFVREMIEQRQKAIEAQARAELERERERERERARFVFVQPKLDLTTPRVSPRADLSDKDRRAQTVERAERPTNPLPFARGNSPERIEAPPTNLPPKPSVPEPAQPQPNDADSGRPPLLSNLPAAPERPPDQTRPTERGPAVGVIADAIRNVRRYTQPSENYGNVGGGQDQNVGESIQFDNKGVDFGWWLRRFVAQVRNSWIIPQAAMSMHGNVSISFIVHKDGRITDVVVARPSAINAFTLSGRNAILSSNPTIPLPVEYPDDRMPITVTFFFNETPPGR